ncbi:hypothetical protein, partial [Candidatus Binatus sp.]|uniref:hypothetical protein n=1 Tax=Candidatus Binatus sp. TaxID=2811406 RepID=UPI003C342A48
APQDYPDHHARTRHGFVAAASNRETTLAIAGIGFFRPRASARAIWLLSLSQIYSIIKFQE